MHKEPVPINALCFNYTMVVFPIKQRIRGEGNRTLYPSKLGYWDQSLTF